MIYNTLAMHHVQLTKVKCTEKWILRFLGDLIGYPVFVKKDAQCVPFKLFFGGKEGVWRGEETLHTIFAFVERLSRLCEQRNHFDKPFRSRRTEGCVACRGKGVCLITDLESGDA